MSAISIEKFKYQRAAILDYLCDIGIGTHQHNEDLEKLKSDNKKRQLEALGIIDSSLLSFERERVKKPLFFICVFVITLFFCVASLVFMVVDIIFRITNLYSAIYIIWSLSWLSLLITNIVAIKEWKNKK